jgi:hypothetical protein
VTSPIGAIPEMLRDNATYVRGAGRWHTWWLEPVYQEQFVRATVSALLEGGEETLQRDAIRKQAHERFRWTGLIDKWDALVRG